MRLKCMFAQMRTNTQAFEGKTLEQRKKTPTKKDTEMAEEPSASPPPPTLPHCRQGETMKRYGASREIAFGKKKKKERHSTYGTGLNARNKIRQKNLSVGEDQKRVEIPRAHVRLSASPGFESKMYAFPGGCPSVLDPLRVANQGGKHELSAGLG